MTELVAFCEGCRGVVAPGSGSLWIDFGDAMRAVREFAELEDRARTGPDRLPSVAEILSGPRLAPWRVHHDACHPQPDDPSYGIGVAQVATWRQLVEWTAHLMAKTWFPYTTWRPLLVGAVHGDGPLRPPTPAPAVPLSARATHHRQETP